MLLRDFVKVREKISCYMGALLGLFREECWKWWEGKFFFGEFLQFSCWLEHKKVVLWYNSRNMLMVEQCATFGVCGEAKKKMLHFLRDRERRGLFSLCFGWFPSLSCDVQRGRMASPSLTSLHDHLWSVNIHLWTLCCVHTLDCYGTITTICTVLTSPLPHKWSAL